MMPVAKKMHQAAVATGEVVHCNSLLLAWPPPAEPRGEKKLFFVQILGGEKLLKFGEKWAVKNF